MRSDDAVTETALISAAAHGDAEAFGQLYDRYVERVYRHVLYRVGRRQDAEDITQQVFLQAWRAMGRYQERGAPFWAWLLRITHNVVVSFYRRRREHLPLDEEGVLSLTTEDAEGTTLAGFDRNAVRRAIARLQPDQQMVLVMRFAEELPFADISATSGKSEGHLRVIQHRALLALRRLLTEEVNPS